MNSLYLERRYLLSFQCRRLPHIFTDVLVVGGGVAGLRAAIEAADGADVILLAKGGLADSNTYHAQGGMAAVISEADSLEAHARAGTRRRESSTPPAMPPGACSPTCWPTARSTWTGSRSSGSASRSIC